MANHEKNVADFIVNTGAEVGKFKARNFRLIVGAELDMLELKSPIEKIFYIALAAYSEYYSFQYTVAKTSLEDSKSCQSSLIFISSQFEIGKYKVDFLIETYDVNDVLKSVVVELDGHDFHDKDKHQRAYEKSRDRFITREGYKALHFTGSELVSDPFKAVLEVFNTLEIVSQCHLDFYTKNLPFLLD